VEAATRVDTQKVAAFMRPAVRTQLHPLRNSKGTKPLAVAVVAVGSSPGFRAGTGGTAVVEV